MCQRHSTEVILGSSPTPHSSSFQVTNFRCQGVENPFHRFQVPIIQLSTETETNGQVTARDVTPRAEKKQPTSTI